MTLSSQSHGPMAGGEHAKQALDALAAEAWEALIEREPFTALTAGLKVKRFPRGDLADAEAVAGAARGRLDRLNEIDTSVLGRTDRLTAAHLRHWFEDETNEPQRWWTGFGIAPYNVASLATFPGMLFSPIDLADAAEADRYVKLAGEFADAIHALRERVLAQAERGWRLPKPALPNARKTLEGIAASAAHVIALAEDRGAADEARAAVKDIVEDRIRPAFARLVEAIGPDYEAAAPADVGLARQPGGAEAYRHWIRYFLGFDADPEEIHRTGIEEVERLAKEMARVRVERFGHNGDEAAFHERLRADPKAKAPTPEALEATYKRHLDRMAPVFARIIRKAPQARPMVKRLAPELEAGMTMGYYSPPTSPGADGIYHYSGNGIPDRLQMNAPSLIFHELVPGHHVHITRQAENEELPDLRRRTFTFGAFNEGWAEYSAGLGDEEGLYDDPYDHYGWLAHQRFMSQRLVVDTGMNALGWTLRQAQEYMGEHTLESPTQIASETLRYSTDLPGQALGYRVGFLKFRALREKAKAKLGDRFDIADFHEAILEQGALPLPVLERSLDDWAEEQLREG